jgi:aquaporin NIP
VEAATVPTVPTAPSRSGPPARPGLRRRATAELLAAFALIFCVGGAAAAEGSGHAALGLPAQAAVSGLAIMGLIYAVGHLSGAHINPAVTLAFTVTRHFPSREALAYIVAQLVGAALAGLLLLAAWPGAPGHLGANVASVSTLTAFLYEIVLTSLLMFVITAVATDTRAVGAGAAIAIGGVVALDILVGGGVSGASMNPARSFGPALASGTWTHFWIYVAGPIIGAVLGAGAYQHIRATGTPPGGAA